MRIQQNPDDWRALYRLFLQSPEWKAKRKLVLKRANGVCECCLDAPADQVHHVHYPQPCTLETLTHQPAWSLRAICEPCHGMFEGSVFVGPPPKPKTTPRKWGAK